MPVVRSAVCASSVPGDGGGVAHRPTDLPGGWDQIATSKLGGINNDVAVLILEKYI